MREDAFSTPHIIIPSLFFYLRRDTNYRYSFHYFRVYEYVGEKESRRKSTTIRLYVVYRVKYDSGSRSSVK